MSRVPTTPLLLAALLAVVPSTGTAQGRPAPDADQARSLYLTDLPTLARKFVALAEAFPSGAYDWRPAPGIRSVRDVLTLMIVENGVLLPQALGVPGMAGTRDTQRETAEAVALLDKPAVAALVRRSFAFADSMWRAVPPEAMRSERTFFGQMLPTDRVLLAVITDQHEHLGQLIAYARTNGVVPPWSGPAKN